MYVCSLLAFLNSFFFSFCLIWIMGRFSVRVLGFGCWHAFGSVVSGLF